MTTEDMFGSAAVVASDHPEEELCGTSRGRLEERVATLKPGCQIHQLHAIPDQQQRNFAPVTLPTATDLVRTFSDDGSSALVNAVIPGLGWCQVKRCDLLFQEVLEVDPRPHRLSAVSIQFTDTAQSSGLPQFMTAIGSSLNKLSIGGSASPVDLNGILRSCPKKLQALGVHQGFVEVKFSFGSQTTSLPRFNWNDITQLANHLSDMSGPLAKCVRRLNLRLVNLADPDGWVQYERTTGVYLDALLRMLAVNKTLEYLKVTVPSECHVYEARFKAHHNSPVQRSLRLPLENKLAFLSVQTVGWEPPSKASKRAKKAVGAASQAVLGGLDEHVTSKIFQFAARLVRRQVYFREEFNEDTGPEDEADFYDSENTPPEDEADFSSGGIRH